MWNYRVVRRNTFEKDSFEFECEHLSIHEVYYDDDDNPIGYAPSPVNLAGFGEDEATALSEIEDMTESVILALNKPILNEEDFANGE